MSVLLVIFKIIGILLSFGALLCSIRPALRGDYAEAAYFVALAILIGGYSK